MKRRIVLSLVAALVLTAAALTGCMVSTGAGSVAIDFGAAAKALGAGESYRVDVYYGRDRFTTVTSVGETITLDSLPTGQATIYVARGTGSGAAFVASRFAKLELSIVPGDNAPGAITLADTDFVADTSEGAVTSAVAANSEVFAYTGAGLLKRGQVGALVPGPALPAGMTDVSLSRGTNFDGSTGSEAQVWVNGSWSLAQGGGILPWTGTAPGSLDPVFVDGFDVLANWDDASQPSFTVFNSGAFFANDDADNNNDLLAIFYRRNGGIGGVAVERDELAGFATWPWVMDQIDLSAQLGEALPAGQEPILDFAVGGDALYVVASFTVLKISEEAMDDPSISADAFFDSPYVGFAEGVTDPVVSIGLGPAAAYLGTANGLWSGPTSAETEVFFSTTPTRIDATAGYTVRTLAVSGDGEHVAFVTERDGSPDTLALLTVDTGVLDTYSTLQGLPGEEITSLSWLDSDTLVVAGSGGLAQLDIAP